MSLAFLSVGISLRYGGRAPHKLSSAALDAPIACCRALGWPTQVGGVIRLGVDEAVPLSVLWGLLFHHPCDRECPVFEYDPQLSHLECRAGRYREVEAALLLVRLARAPSRVLNATEFLVSCQRNGAVTGCERRISLCFALFPHLFLMPAALLFPD